MDLADLFEELGVDDPDQLVAQPVLLFDGANVAANTGSTRTATGCAKAIAEVILPGRPADDHRAGSRRCCARCGRPGSGTATRR